MAQAIQRDMWQSPVKSVSGIYKVRLKEDDIATIHLKFIGNVTLKLIGLRPRQTLLLKLEQDGVGSRVITWEVGRFQWIGGAAPVLTTNANAVDQFIFLSNGASKFQQIAPSAMDVK